VWIEHDFHAHELVDIKERQNREQLEVKKPEFYVNIMS